VGAELERPFPVAVRAFGPGGTRVADRLARLLAEWHAAGRPAATELSVRAHPVDTDPPLPGPGTVIRKRHSALVLDWPGNPVVDAPILER
jgi:protein-L-isoaspartate(D-aspartate) O-methyltransferase